MRTRRRKDGAIEVVPAPLRAERRDRFRRARQQRGGIGAGRARRPEPEARDDAEVAAPGAGERPPELAIRIRRLPGRDDDARPPVRIDGDDLDGVTGSPRRARAGGRGTRTRRRRRARPCRCRGTRPAERPRPSSRASARNVSPTVAPASTAIGAPLRVEGDALHRRDVDDDLDLGIRNEPFQAMPAAGHDQAAAFAARRPPTAATTSSVERGEADVVGARRRSAC